MVKKEFRYTLGWYSSKQDIEQEIVNIQKALINGLKVYELKYYEPIEFRGIFGQPKSLNK